MTRSWVHSQRISSTDMENDEEVIEIWWSQDDRNFKLAAEWNSGVQIAFPNMVVGATA